MVTQPSVQITGTKCTSRLRVLVPFVVLLLQTPFTVHSQPAASLTAERIVQKHLGIFQVVDEFLDPFERVEERDGELVIWFRTAVTKANQAQKTCAGARWLIAGRLGDVSGSKKLFLEHEAIKAITLVFYDVKTSVKLNQKNRYRQSRALVEHARFKLSREQSLRLDMDSVRRALSKPNCSRLAGELLTEMKVLIN